MSKTSQKSSILGKTCNSCGIIPCVFGAIYRVPARTTIRYTVEVLAESGYVITHRKVIGGLKMRSLGA